jgi:hypothetical protein
MASGRNHRPDFAFALQIFQTLNVGAIGLGYVALFLSQRRWRADIWLFGLTNALMRVARPDFLPSAHARWALRQFSLVLSPRVTSITLAFTVTWWVSSNSMRVLSTELY